MTNCHKRSSSALINSSELYGLTKSMILSGITPKTNCGATRERAKSKTSDEDGCYGKVMYRYDTV